MKNNIAAVLAFVAGAAIGSLVTWKFTEAKYKRIADEEIESVIETFSKRNKKEEDPNVTIIEKDSDEDYKAYTSIAKAYTNDIPEKKEGGPYVISPDEFNEKDGYEALSLTYYADGILADIDDNVVGDMEDSIGLDSLTHFGEFGEDDSVFVRNDSIQTDFEITRDYREFSDVVGEGPYFYVTYGPHRDSE